MLLGEAYAFGVVWSFAMKSLSVLVLRFKMPEGREWRVPFNLHIKGVEIPIGLGLITLFLFALAVVNVVTKEIATTAGVAFTLAFFTIFQVSEHFNRKKMRDAHEDASLEKFRLASDEDVTPEALSVRAGSVLVAVRNPNRLTHLRRVLQKADTTKIDVIVVSVRRVSGEHLWTTDEYLPIAKRKCSARGDAGRKRGQTRQAAGSARSRPDGGAVQTAARLGSARIVVGTSPRQTISEQGIEVGAAWEKLPTPRPTLSLEVVPDDGSSSVFVNLGPHPPRLWPEDIDLLHKLWLDLSETGPRHRLHHRDVVGLALHRLQQDLQGPERDTILRSIGDLPDQAPADDAATADRQA